ncbi:HNH endonuclease [Pararhizobium gei]|uniref:HNH endonuclease n=1 Tax=Pararhizobium gei TaxID=1395951 RepID=UPI0023DA0DA9|nr:HNH endonuclease signature motif containing protein [Rhizobium gei]
MTDRAEYRRWYSERAWWKLRSQRLKAEPWCRFCRQAGVMSAATIADHIRPHRGDRRLFFDRGNLQSLCKPCHDKIKQGVEARGYDTRIGSDGLPIDTNHPFYK